MSNCLQRSNINLSICFHIAGTRHELVMFALVFSSVNDMFRRECSLVPFEAQVSHGHLSNPSRLSKCSGFVDTDFQEIIFSIGFRSSEINAHQCLLLEPDNCSLMLSWISTIMSLFLCELFYCRSRQGDIARATSDAGMHSEFSKPAILSWKTCDSTARPIFSSQRFPLAKQ